MECTADQADRLFHEMPSAVYNMMIPEGGHDQFAWDASDEMYGRVRRLLDTDIDEFPDKHEDGDMDTSMVDVSTDLFKLANVICEYIVPMAEDGSISAEDFEDIDME